MLTNYKYKLVMIYCLSYLRTSTISSNLSLVNRSLNATVARQIYDYEVFFVLLIRNKNFCKEKSCLLSSLKSQLLRHFVYFCSIDQKNLLTHFVHLSFRLYYEHSSFEVLYFLRNCISNILPMFALRIFTYVELRSSEISKVDAYGSRTFLLSK